MKKLNKLVFFGNERIATGLEIDDAPTLRALIDEGYQIAAVVAHYSKGRSRKSRKLEIAEVAEQYNIPVLLPSRLKDIKEDLQSMGAEAAVLVAYGKMVPQDIIDIFPKGILNIHPSLLPKYRGPTPVEQSILDGVSITGVSIMKLTAGMDAGPIYAQAQYKLERHETKQELARHLLKLGKDMLIGVLPPVLDGTLEPYEQNHAKATFTHLLTKDDGIINPSIQTAKEIERSVRAYAGYPKTKLVLNNRQIVLTQTEVVQQKEPGQLDIECHDNSLLRITELIGPSGRSMSGEDFVRGYMK